VLNEIKDMKFIRSLVIARMNRNTHENVHSLGLLSSHSLLSSFPVRFVAFQVALPALIISLSEVELLP
jgi:hypothetical protein